MRIPSACFIGPPVSTNSCMHVRSKAGGRCSPRGLAQPREQVVGVEHRGLGRLLQAVGAERAGCRRRSARRRRSCPGSRAGGRSTSAGRRRGRTPGRRRCPTRGGRPRRGRNGSMRSETAIGPGARAAAAVRLRERLVQVEVDDVEAHVARARAPHHRVEVRAVVVERRARVVDERGDLLDVRVEQPERVRVGEHQAGDVVARLGACRSSTSTPPRAFGADLDDLVAAPSSPSPGSCRARCRA